jgi:tetratricopeptide (TPR) repeat protein
LRWLLGKQLHFDLARINAQWVLGRAYHLAGKRRKADQYFKAILEEKDNYNLSIQVMTRFFLQIGELLEQDGQNHKSLVWFKEALKLKPNEKLKKIISGLEMEK